MLMSFLRIIINLFKLFDHYQLNLYVTKKKIFFSGNNFFFNQIGTALFVTIGLWGTCSAGGVIAGALSFGLALMVLAASFGHISGVHFNPSVTIGVLIAGEMQAVMAILYVVMQLLGGETCC